jgi:hypothetical protein
MSSVIPEAGEVETIFGLSNPYDAALGYGPLDGDELYFWNGSGFQSVVFDSTMPTGFGDAADVNPVPEPQLGVGQGFIFDDTNPALNFSQSCSP